MKITKYTIQRLSKYQRIAKECCDNGTERISSKYISEKLGLSASQVRQDLNYFGTFGQQGYGYNVCALYDNLSNILGNNIRKNIIIIGAGNLGRAIAKYKYLSRYGFKIISIFDNKPDMIGVNIENIIVDDIQNLENFMKNNQVDICVLTASTKTISDIVNIVKNNGCKAFWNFVETPFKVPEGCIVENIHLMDSLQTLSFNNSNS